MRSKIIYYMVKGYGQVIEKSPGDRHIVVKWYHFFKDAEIAGFLDIAYSSQNEPHRIIVKSSTNIVVSTFCKRLVLVITPSVRKLSGSNVDNSFACAFGYLVHKSNKVLIRIAEAHSTTNTGFKE